MPDPVHVLLVEDSELAAALILEALKTQGLAVSARRVQAPDQLIAALETDRVDIILCDYVLPHMTALSVLELLSTRAWLTPVVVVTGAVGEEDAAACIRLGAKDFILKSNLARLGTAVERTLKEARERGRAAARSATQAAVVRTLAESLPVEAGLSRVLAALLESLRWDCAALWLRECAVDAVRCHQLVSSRANPCPALDAASRVQAFARGQGLPGRVWERGVPDWVEDVSVDPRFLRAEAARKDGLRAGCFAPIVIDGRMIGHIELFSRQAHPRDEDLLQTLQSVGSQLGHFVQRRRAMDALERTRVELADLVENAAVGIQWLDRGGGILWANRHQLELLGWSAAELTGRCFSDVVVTPGTVRFLIDEVSRGRRVSQLEVQVKCRDGSLCDVLVGADGLWEGEQLIKVRCFLLDVTERKLAEQRLALQHAVALVLSEGHAAGPAMTKVLRSVCSALGWDLGALWAPEGDVLVCNEVWHSPDVSPTRFEKVTRATRFVRGIGLPGRVWQSAQPAWVPDVVSDDNFPRAAEAHADGLHGGLAFPIRFGEGVIGVMEFFSRAVRQPDAKLLSVMQTVGNQLGQFLERRRTEDAHRALEEQLQQSQKMEAFGQLAGGVAHDFNNLLSVILGYSDSVLEGLHESDPLREEVQPIRRAAERASALTRQLVAFSRRQVVQPRVLNLNAVIRDMIRMLQRLIGEGVKLETRLAEDLEFVRADPGQVEQVVLNLVLNARDALSRGGTILIRSANALLDAPFCERHLGARPGPHVELSVEDDGCGMDATVRSRLFEPFFTTKPPGRGTGLGLATVYGIVQQSQGYIRVESAPGQGTTFHVLLPRCDAPPDAAEAADRPLVSPVGHERILVVEDEGEVRHLTTMILQRAGFDVMAAASAEEAISVMATASSFDLVITDVVMPGTSGPALVELVRRRSPRTRALFMSGYTAELMAEHGLHDQGPHLLEKPFTATSLMRRVRETLDRPEG